jgi:hypothetical protein
MLTAHMKVAEFWMILHIKVMCPREPVSFSSLLCAVSLSVCCQPLYVPVTLVLQKMTVSEVFTASTIRDTSPDNGSSTLMMEVVSTLEVSVNFYKTTLCNIPEDGHLQTTNLLIKICFYWTSSLTMAHLCAIYLWPLTHSLATMLGAYEVNVLSWHKQQTKPQPATEIFSVSSTDVIQDFEDSKCIDF